MPSKNRAAARERKMNMTETNRLLFDFIAASPTPYHAVSQAVRRLEESGFIPLSESEEWQPECGKSYYVTRGGSSLIAFTVPQEDYAGFMIAASHSDSPTFRLRQRPCVGAAGMTRLSVEGYGGMLKYSWLDRPLSVAGRVTVRTPLGAGARLVDLGAPCAVIPSVAIHMRRGVSESDLSPAVDMLPLFSASSDAAPDADIMSDIAEAAGVDEDDILSHDLMLYEPSYGEEWNGLICAPRLDDLQCAYASLEAFLCSGESGSIKVYCLLDNEEVGSRTRQGADSSFLRDTLDRVVAGLGGDGSALARAASESFLVSCDNAHAVHPAHPELSDPTHAPVLGGGIVIKYNAAQHYTTDGVSSALFRLICEEAGVAAQDYANRADMPGGSTLGNISASQFSVCSVDIGIAQLAMHSCRETAGASDTEAMLRALTVLYEQARICERDGAYQLL